jgi:hypothetical protein
VTRRTGGRASPASTSGARRRRLPCAEGPRLQGEGGSDRARPALRPRPRRSRGWLDTPGSAEDLAVGDVARRAREEMGDEFYDWMLYERPSEPCPIGDVLDGSAAAAAGCGPRPHPELRRAARVPAGRAAGLRRPAPRATRRRSHCCATGARCRWSYRAGRSAFGSTSRPRSLLPSADRNRPPLVPCAQVLRTRWYQWAKASVPSVIAAAAT